MHFGKMQWVVLAGLLVAANAFADGPQTPQERLMIEKLKVAYQKQGLIRLDTGQRATVFHRALGIQSFNVVPLPNGSIKVTGAWDFHGHPSQDVRTLFTSTPASHG